MIELTKEREEQLIAQMKDVFGQNPEYVKIDDESVKAYLDFWKQNKSNIYDMFSKRSEWNKDELCLVVKAKTKREADKNRALKLICKVLEKMKETNPRTSYYERMFNTIIRYNAEDVLRWEPDYSASHFTNSTNINDALYSNHSTNYTYSYWYHQAKLRQGQKHSKVILKLIDIICNQFGFDYVKAIYTLDETCKIRLPKGGFKESNDHNWEQLKAKICDALLPLEVDQTFYISLNPLDYLTMSHGDGWESCHSLRDDGCYHSATVTMLSDPSTVIVYTLSNNPENRFWDYDKQTRQIVSIADDLDGIFQQVFYPSKTTNDTEVIKKYLQEIISEYKQSSEKWIKSNYRNENIKCREYLGYTDWNNGKESTLTKISGSSPKFVIGKSVPYLDEATATLSSTSRLSHYSWVVCNGCGKIHRRSDCHEYDYDEYYCDTCYREKFIVCDKCDRTIPDDKVIVIDGKRYCENCAKKIDYKVVEDGTNRTEYIIYVNGDVKEYFSSVDALKQIHPSVNYCETDKIYYSDSKCPICVANEKFNKKKQSIIDIINTLDEISEFYQYKEQFLTILSENDLPDEIRELIMLKGE